MSSIHYVPETSHRFYAKIIDGIFVLLLNIPVLVVACRSLDDDGVFVIHWSYVSYYLLVSVFYDFIGYYFFRQTIGKWIFDLYLVHSRDPDQELNFWQILNRILMARMSFFFSWALYGYAFFRYDRRHIADLVAETRIATIDKRKSAVKIRWIYGTYIIIFSLIGGFESAVKNLNSIHFERPYFYFNLSSFSKNDT